MSSSASSPIDSNRRPGQFRTPSSLRPLMKPANHTAARGRIAAGFVCLVLMAGCAVGPNYKRPSGNAPENFRFADGTSTNSFGDLPWWEVFKDPRLLDLITIAVTNNHDLRQAMARVDEARNLAVVARAPLLPQVGYGGQVGRGRNALFNSP